MTCWKLPYIFERICVPIFGLYCISTLALPLYLIYYVWFLISVFSFWFKWINRHFLGNSSSLDAIAETDDNAAMFVWGESNNQLAQNKWVFMHFLLTFQNSSEVHFVFCWFIWNFINLYNSGTYIQDGVNLSLTLNHKHHNGIIICTYVFKCWSLKWCNFCITNWIAKKCFSKRFCDHSAQTEPINPNKQYFWALFLGKWT